MIARKLTSAGALGALLLAGLPAARAAGASTSVSTNWAGYISTGTRFSSVSGTWRQPAAICTRGRATYSAVWVGLGGYREDARSLEQVGTGADCTRSGRAVYSSWYELLPADSVSVPLKVHPGDELSASVTVRGRRATLRLRNLTTGKRFSITKRASSIDTSSAEWIVEAPSLCATSASCRTLALADFGIVPFASATATAQGHTGRVADGAWSYTALELRQSALAASRSVVSATPTLLSATGAFSVSWGEQAVRAEEPPPQELPGSAP